MSTLTFDKSGSWKLDRDSSLSSSERLRKQKGTIDRSSLAASRRDSFSALIPQKRKSNDLSDLTVDKLRFDSLGLHGRQEEIKFLNEELESLIESSGHERRITLISGKSGTGKTRLAETLKCPVSRRKGLFVRGKFDLNLHSQPYSGIANACAEICGSILELQHLQPDRTTTICHEIEDMLADELALLLEAIPILIEIVHKPDSAMEERNSISSQLSSTRTSKNRIHFAFVRFMRVIANHFSPLVFVLDDLQWADVSSLELLELLIADREVPKLMLIGIFRSNELNETSIINPFLEDIQARRSNNDLWVTHLEIDDLDLNAVNQVIQDLMQFEDSQTLCLAEICYKKTHGNPFFLLHFLSMLYEHQLLEFHYGTLSWTWNLEEIEMSTSACDNVVELLQDQMNKLPGYLLELLKLASCLGSTFDEHHLQIICAKLWDSSPYQENDFSCLVALDELGSAGFVVKVSEKPLRFSWVHDKICEAAMNLIPDSERGDYSLKIGRILESELGVEELDCVMFVVVDLLNSASVDTSEVHSRLKLCNLNLKASQKAVKLSAFESAAKYAGKGITLLPDNAWDKENDQLTLQLYSIGAKAESFLGNFETMDSYCSAVLNRDIPLRDKLHVYSTLLDGMSNRSRVGEAITLTLDVLKMFDCCFPKSSALIKAAIVANVLRIKTTMKARDLSKLPLMKDETRIGTMKLLDQLFSCFYTMNDSRMPLVVFRSFNWTLRYGVCVYSPSVFASVGMILMGLLDDLQGAATCAQHALSLLDKTKSTATAARTMFLVHSFLFPWTRPIRDVLKPLLHAYDLGLKTGDTDNATFAIYQWLVFKFHVGSSLESLGADMVVYIKQMRDLKKEQIIKLASILHQLILNLLGQDNVDDPTCCFGKGMSEEQLDMSRRQPLWNASVCRFHGVLLTYFGEHTRQADIMVDKGYDYLAKCQVATGCIMHDTYLKGVSSFAAARQTGKRKYARLGEICRSKIKKWLNMGNPNVRHYESFLDAEAMALQGKNFLAIKHYEVAVLLSARGGYQHDAALASERLGEFHFFVMKDRDEGAYRLREAAKYWRGWGALAKVQDLEQKYPDVFSPLKPVEVVALNIPLATQTKVE